MGGSKSSSEQKTDQSTTITETITTTLGDVGLTGENAVALANVVQQGVLAQTEQVNALVKPIIDSQGELVRSLEQDGAGNIRLVSNRNIPDKIAGIPSEIAIAAAAGAAIWALTKVKR